MSFKSPDCDGQLLIFKRWDLLRKTPWELSTGHVLAGQRGCLGISGSGGESTINFPEPGAGGLRDLLGLPWQRWEGPGLGC